MTTTPNIPASAPRLRVTSFGFGHAPAPHADFVLDLRDWFRDPHISPELRQLTGRDPQVIAAVLSTSGVAAFLDRFFGAVAALIDLDLGAVTVAVGCVGGRHRSAVIADQLVYRARSMGWPAEAEHRDIAEPVLAGARRR